MMPVSAWELGGTLFVPAIHKHLHAIASGEKFPNLRSLVIDTEDGISESDLAAALKQIRLLLPTLQSTKPFRFLRPRNPDTLKTFLEMEGIDKIDGFVLPKFGMGNADRYLDLLESTSFSFMPSIEGVELFDPSQLAKLRERLLPFRSRIPLIRFGAEDMLRQLGLRRDCTRSLFDMAAPSYVIGALVSTFKPYGFELSGTVFRCYKDHEGFKKDVIRDLAEGLISKTVIHPDQVDLIEQCYRVTVQEIDESEAILRASSAVFSLNDAMAEISTQNRWAAAVSERKSLFGMISPLQYKDHAG